MIPHDFDKDKWTEERQRAMTPAVDYGVKPGPIDPDFYDDVMRTIRMYIPDTTASTFTGVWAETQGTRHNAGKRRWGLLPFNALEEVVKVLEVGAIKYGSFNWQKGLSWTETFESLQRHLLKWFNGENVDEESGLNHMAHVATNSLFLLYFVLTGKGRDDRPKT